MTTPGPAPAPRPRSGHLLRFATAGVVAGSAGLPVLELARIGAGWTPSPGHATPALVATAGYLPLHLRHVWYAVHGARPPAGAWTLAGMAVVVVGALPVIGTSWLIALPPLAVSVLVVVRSPWSLLVVAGLVAAPVPVTVASGATSWAPYYSAAVIWQGASLFVLVWLVGASRKLQASQLALADQAVARERLRIDGELRRTLGSALEAIVATGRRAGELARRDPVAGAEALRELVDGSRLALAEARRMVTRYQRVSLREELDTAATLLRAGGVETELVLPPDGVPETIEPGLRSALRSAVARTLRDGTARSCAIVVTNRDGRPRFDLRTADADPPARARAAG